jgi:carboxymethylenebutenolidase
MSVTGLNPTQSGTGFLTFNSLPPRLHITADDDEFDETTIQHWREEGFDVTYLPFTDDKAYISALKHLADDLELGEAYALVAYGRAASVVLNVHIKPQPHLCALVAYYPEQIVSPNAKYPSQLQLVVHVAGTQNFSPAFKSYRYSGTKPGFAEHDLEEFDKVAAELSWTRSLQCVRKGFKRDVDLEGALEANVLRMFLQLPSPFFLTWIYYVLLGK